MDHYQRKKFLAVLKKMILQVCVFTVLLKFITLLKVKKFSHFEYASENGLTNPEE